jgi:Trypsin-like peptidase domain
MILLDVTSKAMFAGILCAGLHAQVAPPKHESGAAHVKHSRAQNYSDRFDAIKCAVVQIFRGTPTVGTPYGTGFYISADGDIATASHVVGERVWTPKAGGVTVDLNSPDSLTVISSSGEPFTVPKSAIEQNREAWGADVVRIATGKKTNCWLAMGDDSKVKPGDLVITMGFPGLAFGSLSMYEGIVSATKIKTNVPMGKTTTGALVTPENEFIRVQMPISGGLSGAPILNDENRAIAVVSLAGVWNQDLDLLIQLSDMNQLGPVSPAPNMLNLAPLVGQLAKSFHQYASPGYGDSVPLRYLKTKTEGTSLPSSQSAR